MAGRERIEMKSNNPWCTLSTISAFLLGVILFWSVGKDWIDLESTLMFLAGLVGVAVSVLGFALLKILNNSQYKEK
jgi:hypothetical protein